MSFPAMLASGAWLVASLPSWLRFQSALSDPGKIQAQILRRLLGENAGSAYGRAHDFESIRSYEDFRERIPQVNHADLAPWIQRVARGESSVLTQEPVTHLIPTSGSTTGRKLIPFTSRFQRELNAAIGPWMIDLCRQHPLIASGTAYWSISPALPRTESEESVLPIGFEDDSGYLGGMRRRLVETTFAAPSLLRQAPDIETSRYLTLLCLLRRRDLRLISIWHPSFLTLLLDSLPAWWEDLLHDVRTGACRKASLLPGALQRVMTAHPNPARAKELATLDPREPEMLWPHLELVSCWGDGQASLAMADLKHRFPQTAIQPKGLLATEAFISIPFQGLHPLAVTSHFYEFGDSRGRVHLAHELEAGETYSVIVTTGGGLWRYRLGDLVEVSEFLQATPSLRFLGREGSVSDLCGEKLAEIFVGKAMEQAFSSACDKPRLALLAPSLGASGHWNYTLFVEGPVSPQLAELMDRELCKNPHYAICRNLGQLRHLRCFKVTGNGNQAYLNFMIKKGLLPGDIKPQALSVEPGWEQIFQGTFVDRPA